MSDDSPPTTHDEWIKWRNARILEAIDRQTRENCSSPEKARAYLIGLGIYTDDGELAPEYGGPERSS